MEVIPPSIDFEDHDDAFVAYADGRRPGQCEFHSALVANIAAAREVPKWLHDWGDIPVGPRRQFLGGLRIFLDACSVCDGPVAASVESIESCCRSYDVVAATFEACSTRLPEMAYQDTG